MFQRGPQEGYMAAKHEVKTLDPRADCEKLLDEHGKVAGYQVVLSDGRRLHDRSARGAWNKALALISHDPHGLEED